MKQIIKSLFIVGLIIGLTTIIFFNKEGKETSKRAYTSKELWEKEIKKKGDKKAQGFGKTDKPDEFTEFFQGLITPIGEKSSGYEMNYKYKELKKIRKNTLRGKHQKSSLNWIERGPSNVGGRTRAIIVAPDDNTNSTWFVGAASGGIWKSVNRGQSWTNLSDNLSNLAVNALAISEANTNILYAGTGESFPGGTGMQGSGIWKSTDKGVSWNQLQNTINANFAYINRLEIDPLDENIVIAATESGIFKTIDGGTSWKNVYNSRTGVEDIIADPSDFNTLYAGEHGIGIIRSVDKGESWMKSNKGLGAGTRFEVAVSPVDNNIVFTSVNVSNDVSNVYISEDKGETWKKLNDNQAFLSTQGDYDNIIEAHPYNAKEAFIGGVDIWHVKFSGTEEKSLPTITNVYTDKLTYIDFINFGGAFLGGGMDTTDHEERLAIDWSSVEIRFGPGLKQKAHLFNVPLNSTSGVPAQDYSYVEYVEVPFQVWDVTNDRQLMVSVRDQERDGEYNLYERTGDEYGELGREYIFVNAVNYDELNPNENITVRGGHLYKSLCMFWPVLSAGSKWEPDNLPEAKIIIDYGTFTLHNGDKNSIADSYGKYGGGNQYNQSGGFGNTAIPGLHPDHHNFVILPKGNNEFDMINTNDGGIAISEDNGETFKMVMKDYITTQFYGISKNPEANEYIGGTQDNGTWRSVSSLNSPSEFIFSIGGDGFECVWNQSNPELILASVYNNDIVKTKNGGTSWIDAADGIDNGDGPFITRLSVSKEEPDLVFAVGNQGVYRTTNFGDSWTKRSINSNWVVDETVSSYHNVEVSLANGNIVWAGGGMSQNSFSLHVSTNTGVSFTKTNNYDLVDMNAYLSGISTHPSEDSTAFALFSLKGKPKVLKTEDLGQSWEDISGFGTNEISSNGFPDVVVHSLLVMPHDPNIIWVGTDIGLIESIDNGISWHIADNGLPSVSAYEMHVFGNQVVVGTHGRGIWTVDIPEIDNAPYIDKFAHIQGFNLNINTNIKVAYDSVQVLIDGKYHSSFNNPSIGITDIPVEVDDNGRYLAQIIAYIGDQPFKSNKIDVTFDVTSIDNIGIEVSDKLVNIYPNPSKGEFRVDFKTKVSEKVYVQVYSLNGALIHIQECNGSNSNVKLDGVKKGTYIIKIRSKFINETHKLIMK